jgi:hypothetical protein
MAVRQVFGRQDRDGDRRRLQALGPLLGGDDDVVQRALGIGLLVVGRSRFRGFGIGREGGRGKQKSERAGRKETPRKARAG